MSMLRALLLAAAVALATSTAIAQLFSPTFPRLSGGGTGCGSGHSTYIGPGNLFAFDRWAGIRAYNTVTADNCLPLIDIVTSVGGTVHTVNSKTDGTLNTADAATFCGGGVPPCFVKRVYEYASGSGLNYDATPATPGPYPSLVFNCLGTYPCLSWDGSPNSSLTSGGATPATGIVFFSAVADGGNSLTTNSRCASVVQTQSRNEMRFGVGPGSNPVVDMTGGGGIGLVIVSLGFHAANGFIAGASTELMIDGVDNGLSQPAGTDTTTSGSGFILGIAPSTDTRCNQMEGGWKDNSQPSATIRGNINANQRAFYGF